jgi:hypothetical protein
VGVNIHLLCSYLSQGRVRIYTLAYMIKMYSKGRLFALRIAMSVSYIIVSLDLTPPLTGMTYESFGIHRLHTGLIASLCVDTALTGI